MASPQEELRERTKQFAYRIIRVFRSLPRTTEAQVIGKQLLRSGTGVAANYRAANRARTPTEFISKIGIVVEGADETLFWLQCLVDNGIVRHERLNELLNEAEQLLAIFAASQQTAKRTQPARSSRIEIAWPDTMR